MNEEPSFAYSFDQEHYHGEFATREEAAATAFAEDEEAAAVWTGKYVLPARVVSARSFIEQMADSTTDGYGSEYADDYLTEVHGAAIAELQVSLQKLWDDWEAKHQLQPDWFTVRSVSEHPRPD